MGRYLRRQLEAFFPDGGDGDVDTVVRRAFERTERCFSSVKLRGFRTDGEVTFDHLHSDQYATFLYLASNTAWAELGDRSLASKLYGLNKALNGLMCMFDTVLPERFLIIHTVGMMLGKAQYGDYFVAIHNATIGTDHGITPRLGTGVVVYGGSAVVGDCALGDEVVVAAHAVVRNTSIPARHVVAGMSPLLVIKPAKRRLIEEFFDV